MLRHTFWFFRTSPDDGSGYNSEVTTAAVIVMIIISGICIIVILHKNVLFCSLPSTALFHSPLTPRSGPRLHL
jgi:hypothetical protein